MKQKKEILRLIIYDYVFKINYVRMLIIPSIAFIFISQGLELFLTHHLGIVGECFINDNKYDYKSIITIHIICILLNCFFEEIQGFVFTGPVKRIYRLCYLKLFEFFISLEYEEFSKFGAGAIHSAIERYANSLSIFIEQLILKVLPLIVIIVLDSIYIYCMLGSAPFLILSFSIYIYIIITISITKWRNKIRRVLVKDIDKVSLKIYDRLLNHNQILAFDNIHFEIDYMNNYLIPMEKKNVILFRSMYLLNFIQKLILFISFGTILICGFYSILMDRIPNALFTSYITLQLQLTSKLAKLGCIYNKITTAFTDIKLYHEQVDLLNYSNEEELIDIANFSHEIDFQNVGYSVKNSLLQKNITLKIKKGEKICIVGRNGVGKSTFIKSLLRFVDYTGKISVDGYNIKNVSKNSLRKILGYVPQDSMLFNETVEYNIKYGNHCCNNIEMIDRCKEFKTHESFIKLSDGYSTLVGESAKSISGGERQRVYLMRILLKNAPILLLDEPTSNIDKTTESFILDSLLEKMKDKTILIILHNLDHLKLFAKILYLNTPDKTHEYGTFDELILKEEGFYEFYSDSKSKKD
ncbi:ABC transporter B family member 25 [Astathelohania contejeani]|uniref:ABC transporter B family member 25 n=1 Tax=Astathelohania contejeani TaxID=164912 RepID=A0ABQ7HZU9_9MICR|nr:ABC transporter B family member 25 [Thelohania contejeani]